VPSILGIAGGIGMLTLAVRAGSGGRGRGNGRDGDDPRVLVVRWRFAGLKLHSQLLAIPLGGAKRISSIWSGRCPGFSNSSDALCTGSTTLSDVRGVT